MENEKMSESDHQKYVNNFSLYLEREKEILLISDVADGFVYKDEETKAIQKANMFYTYGFIELDKEEPHTFYCLKTICTYGPYIRKRYENLTDEQQQNILDKIQSMEKNKKIPEEPFIWPVLNKK